MVERFHIGEWYGYPFLNLSDQERLEMARYKVGGAAMRKSEMARLEALESKRTGNKLTVKENERLNLLREKLELQQSMERYCPFRPYTH